MKLFKSAPIQALLWITSAIIMLFTTAVFGGAPLLVLRKREGRLVYWSAVVVATASIAYFSGAFALAFGVMALVMGLFVEAKELGLSHLSAGAIALLISVGIGSGLAGTWLNTHELSAVNFLKEEVSATLSQVKAIQPNVNIDAEAIIAQLPSGAILLILINLWLALIAENRFVKIESSEQNSKESLSDFKLPDFFIWILIATLAAGLLGWKQEPIKYYVINVANVLALLYFFQGLAVVASFFKKQKVGPVWQAVWYFFIIFQIFILVSILGVVDYWIDFRRKMVESAETT